MSDDPAAVASLILSSAGAGRTDVA
jgi:hypothetical protein